MNLLNKTTLIEQKQQVLQKLQSDSRKALDIVTATIDQLVTVNEKIDTTVGEIEEAKQQLQTTEDELHITKEHNAKIIDKFRALIE